MQYGCIRWIKHFGMRSYQQMNRLRCSNSNVASCPAMPHMARHVQTPIIMLTLITYGPNWSKSWHTQERRNTSFFHSFPECLFTCALLVMYTEDFYYGSPDADVWSSCLNMVNEIFLLKTMRLHHFLNTKLVCHDELADKNENLVAQEHFACNIALFG